MLVLGVILVYVLWPGPDLRTGSQAVERASLRVASRTPRAYRIDYRVETRARGEVVTTTDRLWVRRPFDARQETRSGPPPGRRELSVTVNALARLRTDRAVFAVGPAPASLDRRADASLLPAARAGYAELREVRRVAGRVCRVLRTAGTPSSSLDKVGNGDSYTDTCIDEAGLLLEEVGVSKGDLLTRRVAVRVVEEPALDDDLFQIGNPTINARQGGGSVRRLAEGSRPIGKFWEPRQAPDGFDHEGRYTVVPPQSGFDDPTQRAGLLAYTTDVWRRGIDVIVIEQGGTLGGSAPFSRDPDAADVSLGGLGRGQLIYGFASAEVRVALRAGRFVRVFGTVRPDQLVAVARGLEEVQGDEKLRFAGER